MIEFAIFDDLKWLKAGVLHKEDGIAGSQVESCLIAEKILAGPVQGLKQIHSTKVVAIDTLQDPMPEADAVYTSKSNLFLSIQTADCAPIILVDEKQKKIAAIHAGWKGAYANIIKAAIDQMGSDPSDLRAGIGPLIHPESYEVSAEFFNQFVAQDPIFTRFFTDGDRAEHYQFDLPAFIIYRLQEAGIRQIQSLNLDTYVDDKRFYSFRRGTHLGAQENGRILTIVGMI